MRIFANILTASLFAALINCTRQKQQVAEQQSETFAAKPIKFPPVTGQWQKSILFDYSELTIREDGTFCYFGQECIGRRYSEGKWYRLSEEEISLQSFDEYKFPAVSQINKKTALPIFSMSNTDTIHVYFDKEKFRLKNGELYNSNGKYMRPGERDDMATTGGPVPVFPTITK